MLTKKQMKQLTDILFRRFKDDCYSTSCFFFNHEDCAELCIYKRVSSPDEEPELESVHRFYVNNYISDKEFNDGIEDFKQKIAEINAESEVDYE